LNNVQESTISIMDLVADLSYAWIIIDRYRNHPEHLLF
jgi:hypothetical protein